MSTTVGRVLSLSTGNQRAEEAAALMSLHLRAAPLRRHLQPRPQSSSDFPFQKAGPRPLLAPRCGRSPTGLLRAATAEQMALFRRGPPQSWSRLLQKRARRGCSFFLSQEEEEHKMAGAQQGCRQQLQGARFSQRLWPAWPGEHPHTLRPVSWDTTYATENLRQTGREKNLHHRNRAGGRNLHDLCALHDTSREAANCRGFGTHQVHSKTRGFQQD